MVNVSRFYDLRGNQSTFDFVDVPLESDARLFIDPSAISEISDRMAHACVSSIQSFYEELVRVVIARNRSDARGILKHLSEINYTHLGYSSRSRGSAVGEKLADELFDELTKSRAVTTGLIQDLEEAALVVPNWGNDRVSDVVTHLILQELAQYTEACAEFYGIPVRKDVAIDYAWDSLTRSWVECRGNVPVPNGKPLVLVPKSYVRRRVGTDAGYYYQNYVLDFLKMREEDSPSLGLEKILKSGPRKGQYSVAKKDITAHLKEIYGGDEGFTKRANAGVTAENPQIIEQFREAVGKQFGGPESSERLNESVTGNYSAPDFDSLLDAVLSVPRGRESSTQYEKAIESLLSAIFYPNLVNPRREHKIHDGRKRIDIAYTNCAQNGFFEWLSRHYSSANIFVECKNYSGKLGNPEADQISGRFSPSRGRVGLLVYRNYSEKTTLRARCRDTAKDDRGWIIALDDSDMEQLVIEAKGGSCTQLGGLLHREFENLND